MAEQIVQETTFGYVAKRYVGEILPTKSPRTQKDYLQYLEKLLEFFNDPPAPLSAIKPLHIREYLNFRSSAKVRANREVSLFSVIYNYAREWGYTDQENPTRGVKRNIETGRDVYVSDSVFWRVYNAADRHIQYAMLFAYLSGQRVADCLKTRLSDIQNGELYIRQNKTKTKVRIGLTGTFADVVNALIQERGEQSHDVLFVNLSKSSRHFGKPLTYVMLRGGMDRAREAAKVDKSDFKFMDLRAKAATDKDEMRGIEAARELLGHTTQNMTTHYIRNRKGKRVEPVK